MFSTKLHKVGGSVMLTVPPTLLESAGLAAGSRVGITFDGERLIIEKRVCPKYTLDELLSPCDVQNSEENYFVNDREWLDSQAFGKELI
jgi:antitoxin ChpS